MEAADELIARARAGDGNAFRALTEPFRRELRIHCYRMLGSFQDAEDAVQESLLAAWQSLNTFEGRSSMRVWLYRIATNRALNALRTASRRPAKEWNIPNVEPPEPSQLGEVLWLDPYPDLLLGENMALGPEARYELNESISLAFVTALQLLSPRQRAVLILREVLGYRASEVAHMLDASVDAVNSALKRARSNLQTNLPRDRETEPPPLPYSVAEQALVTKFVDAYTDGDVQGLVTLLTHDAKASMPPIPFEYHGRKAVARFFESMIRQGRHYDLIPTRANGQPAFGMYLVGADAIRHGAGLLVLTLAGDKISATTRFESGVLPRFGLPRHLPT